MVPSWVPENHPQSPSLSRFLYCFPVNLPTLPMLQVPSPSLLHREKKSTKGSPGAPTDTHPPPSQGGSERQQLEASAVGLRAGVGGTHVKDNVPDPPSASRKQLHGEA